MKQFAITVAGVLTALAIAGVVYLVLLQDDGENGSGDFDVAAWESIRPGDSPTAVEAKLGEPDGVQVLSGTEFWQYEDDGFVYEIQLSEPLLNEFDEPPTVSSAHPEGPIDCEDDCSDYLNDDASEFMDE